MRRKWTKERPEVDTTFELLFKNNPLPLWVYDLETLRFLDINEVACHKYGYSREEFLALTMRDIRPPEDIPRMHASVRAHPTENFNSSIWRHRKKDGTTIYVESISPRSFTKGDARASYVQSRSRAAFGSRRGKQSWRRRCRSARPACITLNYGEARSRHPAAGRIIRELVG